jgi:hypothetical protein
MTAHLYIILLNRETAIEQMRVCIYHVASQALLSGQSPFIG